MTSPLLGTSFGAGLNSSGTIAADMDLVTAVAVAYRAHLVKPSRTRQFACALRAIRCWSAPAPRDSELCLPLQLPQVINPSPSSLVINPSSSSHW